MDKTIDELIIWADGISAQWNGDESGLQEDNAHLATEIINQLEIVSPSSSDSILLIVYSFILILHTIHLPSFHRWSLPGSIAKPHTYSFTITSPPYILRLRILVTMLLGCMVLV